MFQRPALPIDPFLREITEIAARGGAVVIEAEPGAGKTTRVPAAVYESGICGGQDIAVLEPRRIAARMTARRVAQEMNCSPGGIVGYQVRFEDKTTPETKIRFMTEGILLRRFADDPELRGTGMVIFDEVHERHLETDTALAICRHLRETARRDLKIAVMSATMNAAAFSEYLGGAPIIRVPGRTHHVTVDHLKLIDRRPLAEQTASAFIRALREGDGTGDILVFLPGAGEIRRTAEKCASIAGKNGIEIRVLHGDLSPEEQDRALADGGKRKLVLATNIAESSLTLPNVTCVIDSGLARILRSDPFTGIPSLQLQRIPKSSAIQRAGRAGRVRDGLCFRLYDRSDFDMRDSDAVPEILRMDLSTEALFLHGLGFESFSSLAWLDDPPPKSVQAAESLLCFLGATEGEQTGKLTAAGRRMLAFPVHPRLARLMAEAERLGFGSSGALAAAILSERDFHQTSAEDLMGQNMPQNYRSSDSLAPAASDVFQDMLAFESAAAARFSPGMLRSFGLSPAAVRNVEKSFQQLKRLLPPDTAQGSRETREKAILTAILAGHPDRVALRRKSADKSAHVSAGLPEFLLFSGGSAKLSNQSQVRDSELIVAVDMEERGRSAQRTMEIRRASEIQPEWLIDLFENQISEVRETFWNDRLQRAEARDKLCYGKLILSETPADPDEEEASGLLFHAALSAGIERFADGEKLSSLRVRVELARTYLSDLNIPEMTDELLREFLGEMCRGRRSFAELEEMSFLEAAAQKFFGADYHKLERLFPQSIQLPGGRKAAVHYQPGQPPWIESRLQDFFGQLETPRIAEGRIPLVVHLLAPNHRPVQVTSDLAGFWERHYPELRKALSRRYPKHAWPEDPAGAEPPSLKRRL